MSSPSIVASTSGNPHARSRAAGLTTAPGGFVVPRCRPFGAQRACRQPPFVDDLSRLRVSLRHDDERSSLVARRDPQLLGRRSGDDARREPDAIDPMSEPRHIRRCSTRHGPTPSRGLPSSQSDRDPPDKTRVPAGSSRCATACCFPSGRDNVSGGRFRRGWAMVGIRAFVRAHGHVVAPETPAPLAKMPPRSRALLPPPSGVTTRRARTAIVPRGGAR
jgi:hypothetical protein